MAKFCAAWTAVVDFPTPPLKFWNAMIAQGSEACRHGRVPNVPRMSLSWPSVYPTRRLFLPRGGGTRRPSLSASRMAAVVRPTRSAALPIGNVGRSEEHTSELQSLMRISYAVFCLKKKNNTYINHYVENSTHNKTTIIYHK